MNEAPREPSRDEPAPDPPALSDPPAASAAAPGEVERGGPAPPAWEPPLTLADRLSPWLRRALLLGVVLLALAAGSALLVWAIPTALASRHPGFQAARQQATSDRSLRMLLGRSLSADRWPGAYELRPEGRSTFGFGVEGELGKVWVVVEVEGERVCAVRRHPNSSWQQRWMLRRPPEPR